MALDRFLIDSGCRTVTLVRLYKYRYSMGLRKEGLHDIYHHQRQADPRCPSPATGWLARAVASDELTLTGYRQRQVGRSAVAGDTLGQSDYRFDREDDEPRGGKIRHPAAPEDSQ